MSYTPIGWQTGDTITAEKLNKMDNGWGVQETQLFSESVTTVDTGIDSRASLTYSLPITASTLIVVLNGTSYTCPKIEAYGQNFYGGFDSSIGAPDFTTYPFFIISSPTGENTLITETAGTYTVTASGEGIAVSDNFSAAVSKCVDIDTSTLPMLCVSGTTKKMEMSEAVVNGRMIYFYYETESTNKMCIITNMYTNPMGLLPSNAPVTAIFDTDEDETFTVAITT